MSDQKLLQKCRVEIRRKAQFSESSDLDFAQELAEHFQIPLEGLSQVQSYTIHKELSEGDLKSLEGDVFCDPVLDEVKINGCFPRTEDWSVEISLKKGVTDNAGKTAQGAVEDCLGRKFQSGERVCSSRTFFLKGRLDRHHVERIASGWLGNPLIETLQIQQGSMEGVSFLDLGSDEELEKLSKERQLALNLEEMKCIQEHFEKEEVKTARAKLGIPASPSDVELEALAQTWSEHCKHKIFQAEIDYREGDSQETIDGLFNRYIRGSTEALAECVEWLVSVFHDNAGVIRFSKNHHLAFKVETHNSPSALDPYGGALTGILGVNRDIMGTGRGCRLLANTDVFCLVDPEYEKKLPPMLLHPRRVLRGVRLGVENGGNKMGVPTVNGSLVFEDRYLGKPLIFCGSVGIMPAEVAGRPTEAKDLEAGDLIVVAGGFTGKDGIHGATFSSEALHEKSPVSAVQIGDPFTQKKTHEFLLEARDLGLYRTLTDNGAGGFSSSVGELAELTGGCELHLDRAPLKAESLAPWEILVSESQERMTLAVPPENWEALQKVAQKHEVDLAQLGTFTNSGRFHILMNGYTVAYLNLDFLHKGLPKMKLQAVWEAPERKSFSLKPPSDFGQDLHGILKRKNVCSKEGIIRQYDHEIQGGSVGKPLCGDLSDGPSDAAVLRPLELMDGPDASYEGVVISHGICPKFSDLDCYHMAQLAVDEAVRNAVAVGVDPQHLALLDNFCWPDPIFHAEKTPDGKHKLAQLVRANQGLYDAVMALKTPLISGKDSMKNDYKMAGHSISVPPTLLISAMGKIPDIRKSVSMDGKYAGDDVYILGITKSALAGSEYAIMHDRGLEGEIPQFDATLAPRLYLKLHEAIMDELISSCHDVSDGGLAVALAETAFSGELGMEVDLREVPLEGSLNEQDLLFSEGPTRFVLTACPSNKEKLKILFESFPFSCVGSLSEEKEFKVLNFHGQACIQERISALKESWKGDQKW